jgi:hypothetical protein
MAQAADPACGQITQLLKAMHSGDAHAAEELLPRVYPELHRLASAYMRHESPNHTLQPTALIHEALGQARLAACTNLASSCPAFPSRSGSCSRRCP